MGTRGPRCSAGDGAPGHLNPDEQVGQDQGGKLRLPELPNRLTQVRRTFREIAVEFPLLLMPRLLFVLKPPSVPGSSKPILDAVRDAAQMSRVILGQGGTGESNGLIADQARRPIHRPGVECSQFTPRLVRVT